MIHLYCTRLALAKHSWRYMVLNLRGNLQRNNRVSWGITLQNRRTAEIGLHVQISRSHSHID